MAVYKKEIFYEKQLNVRNNEYNLTIVKELNYHPDPTWVIEIKDATGTVWRSVLFDNQNNGLFDILGETIRSGKSYIYEHKEFSPNVHGYGKIATIKTYLDFNSKPKINFQFDRSLEWNEFKIDDIPFIDIFHFFGENNIFLPRSVVEIIGWFIIDKKLSSITIDAGNLINKTFELDSSSNRFILIDHLKDGIIFLKISLNND